MKKGALSQKGAQSKTWVYKPLFSAQKGDFKKVLSVKKGGQRQKTYEIFNNFLSQNNSEISGDNLLW